MTDEHKSMHGADWLALARKNWLYIAVAVALLAGLVIGATLKGPL